MLGAETVAGRIRPLPDIASRDETVRACVRARAERQAVNTVIQGSAADLMKEAMIRTCAALSTRGVSTLMASWLLKLTPAPVISHTRNDTTTYENSPY